MYLFDLAKAFDSLPHSLILKSLARVEVTGSLYNWFVDYLSGHRQRVVLDGAHSPTAAVTSGVPPGSFLGPLLFILSINPLADLSLSLQNRPIRHSEDFIALQSDIHLIEEWVSSCGLRHNCKKTKCMLISRKREPTAMSLSLQGTPLEQVSSHKYLGITISEDLSWSLRPVRPNRCLVSSTEPSREPTNAVWSIFTRFWSGPLSNTATVFGIPTNNAMSISWRKSGFATGNWSRNPNQLRSALEWPLLSTRRSFHKLCLCRKILPHPLHSILTTPVSHCEACPLFRPFVSTNYHRSSFFNSVIPMWNSIPDNIVSNCSYSGFLVVWLLFLPCLCTPFCFITSVSALFCALLSLRASLVLATC